MYWKDTALQLAFDRSRKVECCGDGPSTYISNSPSGIRVGPCFRCGFKDFVPHGAVSAATLLKWKERTDALRGSSRTPTTVPLDEWPSSVLVWLGKAGITADRALRWYGIGYSEETQRVILPILEHGKDTGAFIARSIAGTPKYINSRTAKQHSYITGTGSIACVTEDVLSAIRVGEAAYRGCAALGTSFSDRFIEKAVEGCAVLVSWLDPDKAGQDAHRKLRKACATHDVRVVRVQSDHDPKEHTKQEIISYVKEACDEG